MRGVSILPAPPHRLAVPAVWYVVILVLTLLPGAALEDAPFVDQLSAVAHAVVYVVFGALLRWALAGSRRPTTTTIGWSILLAGANEMLQAVVPDREPSIADFVVDVVAVAVGAAVVHRRRRT